MKLMMKKFILYLFLSLFITQNVYADAIVIGKCIGFFISKIGGDSSSTLTKPISRWLDNNNSSVVILNKINKEQKNCVIPGQLLMPCLSSYSNYDADLYIGMHEGMDLYNKIRYDPGSKALFTKACMLF